MSGIILLVVLLLWLAIVYFVSRFLVKKIQSPSRQIGAQILIASIFFIAPVSDDIVGGFQFRGLCNKEVAFYIDKDKAKNRVLESIPNQQFEVSGYVLPITKIHWGYRDQQTQEVLVAWNEFRAQGGFLSRFIGFPEGSPPYTFDGDCGVKEGFDFDYESLGITRVKRK